MTNEKLDKDIAEWQAKRALVKKEEAVEVKPETEAQRLKREAKEKRENDRYWDAQDRKKEREEAKRDQHAYRAGKDEGDRVTVRPGIKEGTPSKQIK